MQLTSDERFEDLCKGKILEFNRLITTPNERQSQEYLNLCAELVLEEMEELDVAVDSADPVDTLKELCDLFIVKTQLKEVLKGFKGTLSPSDTEALLLLLSMAGTDFNTVFMHFGGQKVFPAILEVCKSNLTKAPLVQEVKSWYGEVNYIESACDWIETNSQGRYTNVLGIEKGGRVLFRADGGKGKLVKWVGYKEPNLASIEEA